MIKTIIIEDNMFRNCFFFKPKRQNLKRGWPFNEDVALVSIDLKHCNPSNITIEIKQIYYVLMKFDIFYNFITIKFKYNDRHRANFSIN